MYACWQGLLVCLLARLGRMPSVNSYPRDIRNAGRSACMLVRTLACMFPGTVCLYACWHGLLVCLLARSGLMRPRKPHSRARWGPTAALGPRYLAALGPIINILRRWAPSCLRVWGPSMPACLGPQKLTLLIPKVNPNHHTFPQFHARAGRRKGRNFMPAQAVVMYDPATLTWRYGLLVCLLARSACMHAGTVCLYACWHGLLVCLLARSACMLAGTVGAHAMSELRPPRHQTLITMPASAP